MNTFRPMLAVNADLSKLRFPVLASPKLDGIRATVIGGRLLSRSLKPIPNAWCQQRFSDLPEGTDGELIYGDPRAKGCYHKTNSAVMSEDGFPSAVRYFIFDNHQVEGGFQKRFQSLAGLASRRNVEVVPHMLVESMDELIALEEQLVDEGYEGLMVRSLDGKYKHGRSTVNEGLLLKVKRFTDSEARVIGVEPWQHNGNEAKTNALGRTERSSAKDGKVALAILGKLVVEGLEEPFKGVSFEIGTGFDGADDPDGERGQLWRVRDSLVGRIAKFKFFASGVKDKPRHPVFLGWRDERDMA